MNSNEIPKEAEERMKLDTNITSASIGYKYRAGKNTMNRAIVFAVEKKFLSRMETPPGKLLPSVMAGLPTDVQERKAFAPPPWPAVQDVSPRAFTQRRRPCPPGYSIGHYLISAGTHGLWGKRGMDEDWRIFSNNHVLANSNGARPNDPVYQPGPHDGGTSSDRIGLLEDYVRINWDSDNGGAGCNIFARLTQAITRRARNEIEQPYPNLVDAAVARVINQGWVDLDYPGTVMGELRGIRDLQLGDHVLKPGRTTEWTSGTVEGVGAMVRVDYGGGKVATYQGQLEIRSDVEGKDFSAGGDSGSAILSEDDYVGGLLFAGGGGVTIANRISDVVALLGLRL